MIFAVYVNSLTSRNRLINQFLFFFLQNSNRKASSLQASYDQIEKKYNEELNIKEIFVTKYLSWSDREISK